MRERGFTSQSVKTAVAITAVIASVGVAIVSYRATRSERTFVNPEPASVAGADRSGASGAPEASAAAAEDSPAQPRRYVETEGASGLGETLSAFGSAIRDTINAAGDLGSLSGVDREALAEIAPLALKPMLAGTPEAFAEAMSDLGGASVVGGEEGATRAAPFSEVMQFADLDLANMSVGKFQEGMRVVGSPQPGSGAFRAARDEEGNPIPTAPGARQTEIRAGGAAPPGAMAPGRRTAVLQSRFGAEGEGGQKKDLYEVRVPARLRGSESAAPDGDIGVLLARKPGGGWSLEGYTVYAQNPELIQKVMASRGPR